MFRSVRPAHPLAAACGLMLLLACGGGGGGGSAPVSTPPPTPAPTGSEVLVSGNMESTTGWAGDVGVIQPASNGSITAHSGTDVAYLGGYGSVASDTLNTEAGIAANATAATLTFWMQVTSAEGGTTAVDTCTVKAYDGLTGASLGTLATLSNLNKGGGWVQYSYDLTAHKGKVVRLEWTSSENASNQTSFFLDDVSVLVAAPTSTPALFGYTPSTGYDGETVVEAVGAWIQQATGMTFNGTAGTSFVKVNGARVRATLPTGASTGNLVVQTPSGSATATTPFPVLHRVPGITAFNPTQGPVGTPVLVEGSHFSSTTAVTVGGTAATYALTNDHQLVVTIPSGAASGVIQVTNAAGATPTGSAFTVTGGGSTMDFFITRAHLNQGTQNDLDSVAPVANRAAYLRVFVRANQSGAGMPHVTVRLTNGSGTSVLSPVGAFAAVPVNPALGTLGDTLNFKLAASDVQVGMSITVDVNDGVSPLAEADATNNHLVWSPTVHDAGTFKTTVIPVTQGANTGSVSAGTSGWTDLLKAMYPVGTVDAALGSTWTYGGAALSSDGTGWDALLTALEAKRVAEASNRYYYGSLKVGYSSGVAGLGYVPNPGSASGRSAIGWDKTGYGDGGDFDYVYTHETGHNLGRDHSPCGNAGGPDPAYPYAGGVIGVPGLDVAADALKSASTYRDIMGYCSPNWVSDYVYKSILAHREATPQPIAAPGGALQPCLVITATANGGGFELGPSFLMDTVPTPAVADGMRLEGTTSGGKSLFTHGVAPFVIGCGPKAGQRAVVAALPVTPELMAQVATLRLVEGGTVLARRDGPSASAKVVAHAPRARREAGGLRLTWDATVHPAMLVRDPVTREIRATLMGGDAVVSDLTGREELLLSDGVRTTRQPMPTIE